MRSILFSLLLVTSTANAGIATMDIDCQVQPVDEGLHFSGVTYIPDVPSFDPLYVIGKLQDKDGNMVDSFKADLVHDTGLFMVFEDGPYKLDLGLNDVGFDSQLTTADKTYPLSCSVQNR